MSADWSCVVDECRRAHFQPLLLVYTNPRGQAVDISGAPKDVVSTPAAQIQSNNRSPETTPTHPLQPYAANQGDMREPISQSGHVESVGGQHGVIESQPAVGPSSVPNTTTTQEEDLITFSLSPVVLGNSQIHASGSPVQNRVPFSSSYQAESHFNTNSAMSSGVTVSETSQSFGQACWGQPTVATSHIIANKEILDPVLHSTLAMVKNSKGADMPIPSPINNFDQHSSQASSSTTHTRAASPSSMPKRVSAGSPSLYPNLSHGTATTTGHSPSHAQPTLHFQSHTRGPVNPFMPIASDSHTKELYSNKHCVTGVGQPSRPSSISTANSTAPVRHLVDESAIGTKTLEEIGQSRRIQF